MLAACNGATGPAPTLAAPSSAAGLPAPSSVPSASPTASASPVPAPAAGNGSAASVTPAAPSGPPAASTSPGTTIELQETENLELLQNGQPVTQLRVKLGDTIIFKVNNSADFVHDFYIGPADKLAKDQTASLQGIPDFQGTHELVYTVNADTANLQFGCPLEGHYPTMHGIFVVTP
jgi:uncharacterized cupredoxin-like copper-binding protein